MRKKSPISFKPPDLLIALLSLGLVAFGLLMVFDASVIEAHTQFSDKFHFVKLQLVRAALGLLVALITTFLPLNIIKFYSRHLFILALVLLALVIIPGVGQKIQGARRWLSLGDFVLQPSELAKLALITYLPTWLNHHQKIQNFLIIIGLLLGLLMLQPDLGTAIIITGTAFIVYTISGAPTRHILSLLTLGLLTGLTLIFISPYRLNRLKTFIDPSQDPLGTSYHIRQVIIALGSGGINGTGVGRSRQKYQYLPEATTDSIFAVVGEETGFIGASVVIIAYAALTLRGLYLTTTINDPYARLLAGGAIAWIAIQTMMNLAAMVVLIPLTGVPLPFLSYGGSSLVTVLAGTGLLLNATRFRKDKAL